MDVDDTQNTTPQQLGLVSYFQHSPEKFAWNHTRVLDIQERRRMMSNQLFFDILLGLGGIGDPAELYPPTGIPELTRLLNAIDNLSFDSMKRDCLVYYLLKWQEDEQAGEFAEEKYISPHYVALADAYWHLDSGVEIGRAVSLLSDARIVKEYSSKVIATLALEDRCGPLILRYVKTCNPILKERNDLQLYVQSLAERNFNDAWQFQRTYPDYDKTRKFLIYEIITLSVHPFTRRDCLAQLLSLPMNRFEEEVLREFAIQPPETLRQSSTCVIRDLVCVRLIQSCKYIEAVKFDRQYPSSTDFAGATTKGTWQMERKRIMEQVLSIMPATERAQLDRELEQIVASSSLGSKMTNSGSGGSWMHVINNSTSDVSMSWEDIGDRSFTTSREQLAGMGRDNILPTRGKGVPLLNGRVPVPNTGTSATRNQPLTTQPTILSQASTVPISSPGNSMLLPTSLNSSTPGQTSKSFPPLRVSNNVSAANTPNTTINGTSTPKAKTNAFMAQNAFFQPPTNVGNSTPTTNGITRSQTQRNNEANRALGPNTTQSTILIDEEDVGPGLEYVPVADAEQTATPQNKQNAVGGVDDVHQSDREDLGYSIFGGTAIPARKVDSSTATPASPRKSRRLANVASVEGQTTVPGAFVEDESEVHLTRSTTRASAAAQSKNKGESRRKVSDMRAPKKRPTPDGGFTPSIPGGLMDDDDYGSVANGHSEDDEEEDMVMPLPSPTKRTRKGKSNVASTPATTRSHRPRRSSSVASTASSVTNDSDGEGTGVSTRAVRRSSRLSNVSTSPPNEKKPLPSSSSRPRKSTRTSGTGATATGKGATKRR